MDQIIKKLIITTGIIACCGIAFLPLTTYAVDPADPGSSETDPDTPTDTPTDPSPYTGRLEDSSSPTVNIHVKKYITLEATSGTEPINVAADMVGTGTITATVSANTLYKLTIMATQPALQIQDGGSSGANIPSRSGDLKTGGSGWGIKKKIVNGTDITDAAEYSEITTTEQVFFTSPTQFADNVLTEFAVGVAVDSSQRVGTYQTDVTITASSAE